MKMQQNVYWLVVCFLSWKRIFSAVVTLFCFPKKVDTHGITRIDSGLKKLIMRRCVSLPLVSFIVAVIPFIWPWMFSKIILENVK